MAVDPLILETERAVAFSRRLAVQARESARLTADRIANLRESIAADLVLAARLRDAFANSGIIRG
jgi:hypothetical protein